MKNKKAKQMIGSVTPVKSDGYFPFNVFPWDNDFMCPYSPAELHKSRRIRNNLHKRFSAERVKLINDELNGCEADLLLGFVRGYDGVNESDFNDGEVGCLFIDEHENGGYSGDSYCGFGYLKVSKKDYLKFSYSM